MDAATLKKVRPTADTTAAIRVSLDLVAEERRGAERRLAGCVAARSGLLLDGTTAQIREADTAARDAQTDIQQFDVMAEELRRRLVDAAAREAGDVRAQQVREVAAAILTFNAWLATDYTAGTNQLAFWYA
jgi:LPS O-antigen subunit length determinant protein (WzzB/FepE family)